MVSPLSKSVTDSFSHGFCMSCVFLKGRSRFLDSQISGVNMGNNMTLGGWLPQPTQPIFGDWGDLENLGGFQWTAGKLGMSTQSGAPKTWITWITLPSKVGIGNLRHWKLNLPLAPEYNVSSWLVARVAIVAIFQIILKLMYFLEGSLLWQNKIGRTLFFEKKTCNCWEAICFLKNAVAQSSFCSSLYLSL